ncbi:MAG: hypothetical protein ABIT07_04375 [Ferruginibacter sp.]
MSEIWESGFDKVQKIALSKKNYECVVGYHNMEKNLVRFVKMTKHALFRVNELKDYIPYYFWS